MAAAMNSTWPVALYHPSLPSGQSPGTLTITDGNAVIQSPAGTSMVMPLESMDMKLGGFNNQQALLSHPHYPGWTVLCTEAGFLRAPEISGHARHGLSAGKAARASRRLPWPIRGAILVMLA